MNCRIKSIVLVASAIFSVFSLGPLAFGQGTAFTYQGRLGNGGSAANGTYDLTFALFNAASGPTQQGSTITSNAIPVSNGLFTVTLDFGNQFPGANRWLEIGIRTNGGGSFTTLVPRQLLTSTPYSITASSLSGTLAASQLSGTISPANIANGTISGAMLVSGAVGSNQLAVGAVTTSALADGAVTSSKMITASNWVLALTLTNPSPALWAAFGESLAAVGSGRVLIGAPGNGNGIASIAGAAYLFSTNGILLNTFTSPTPSAIDGFGGSVAAVGSDRLLIGASGDSTGATAAGAAYLFSTNGTLLIAITNPTPAVADAFGISVAAVGSDRVLIGALNDNTGAAQAGAAYLFSTNGTLLTTFTNPTPAAGDHFGQSVAAVGSDRLLIGASGDSTGAPGAGAAYLFSTNGPLITTFTNPTPAGGDNFGISVAAVGSDRVLIGALNDNTGAAQAGAAYLFSTNGTLLTTFTNPTPAASEFFGQSVAAVGGDRVMIGAFRDNTGAPGAGSVDLFSTNGALLTTFTNPTPAASEFFGQSVAAVGSDRLLIGAPNDTTSGIPAGSAYLFSLQYFVPGVMADGVRDGAITRTSLADKAINSSKIEDGTITTADLANGAVTAVKIGGILNTSQIPNLDASKISSGTFSGNGAGMTNVPGAIPTVNLTGTNVQMQANTAYDATNASQVLFTLPTNAAVGSVARVYGVGAGGWQVQVSGDQLLNGYPAGIVWTPQGLGGNWTSVASSADGSKLVAVDAGFDLNGGQIYTSANGGATWTAQETNRNWRAVASSADGNKLVAVDQGGQIHTSTDGGSTWTANENVRQWISVASSANGSNLVAADAVGSGTGGRVYTSIDGGTSWTAQATNRFWASVASSADGSKLVAVVNGGQIYVSTDGGAIWTPRETNRAWWSAASSADGSKLVSVVNGGQIFTSGDGGTNWIARETNRLWRSVAPSSDGSKLVSVVNGGQIFTSGDGGTNWTARENSRGWVSVASSANGDKLVAVEYGGLIYTSSGLPITGVQGSSIELQDAAGGLWQPLNKLDAANLSGTVSAPLGLSGQNTLEFGAGVQGKEPNAGKIGYQVFSADALDIVGAGSSGSNRKIQFWAEGGSTFNGSVSATAFTGSGSNLTLLSAGNISSGTLADARLSANVALRSVGNNFSGTQTVTNGSVGIGTVAPVQPLQVGDANINGSQGMMRFGSRTPSGGGANRTWDIGVPQTGDIVTGLGYSFVITDATIASNMMVIQYNSGNVGFGNINPSNRLSVGNPFITAAGYGLQVSSTTYGEDVQINDPGGFGLLLHNHAGGNSSMLVIRNGAADTNVFSVSGNGTVVAAGTVTANNVQLTSDRSVKENFQPISSEDVLGKVAALPIEQWNFKADTATRHIGPMAQDFYDAFRVGPDDTHISMVDEGGVALAAIQGLNEKLESGKRKAEIRSQKSEDRIQQLEAENAELKGRLEKLEELLSHKQKGDNK
jgi:hypothetical protein